MPAKLREMLKMRYNKFWLCTIALLCLTFQAYAQSDYLGGGSSGSTMGSSGDYLSPNMGQGASSTNPDAGLAGMSQWLNQPVDNFRPGILGIINNGASVYPAGYVSNAKVYLGGITGANIWLREFVCNSMSACGMYDAARANDGAIVNLGGFKRGATVPNIDGSAVRIVSVAKAKS